MKIDTISCRVGSVSEVRSPPGLFYFFIFCFAFHFPSTGRIRVWPNVWLDECISVTRDIIVVEAISASLSPLCPGFHRRLARFCCFGSGEPKVPLDEDVQVNCEIFITDGIPGLVRWFTTVTERSPCELRDFVIEGMSALCARFDRPMPLFRFSLFMCRMCQLYRCNCWNLELTILGLAIGSFEM
jgi:hypothetical protein